MTPPDPIVALVAYLAADPEVAALAGARVYGAELPVEEVDQMPRKTLLVVYAGLGPGQQPHARLASIRIDVHAYGETAYEASRLDRAAYGALKGLRRRVSAETLLHSATLGGGPLNLRDPDAEWPFVFRSWAVLHSEVAIA